MVVVFAKRIEATIKAAVARKNHNNNNNKKNSAEGRGREAGKRRRGGRIEIFERMT
jgi:hypothetical protein